MLLQSLSTICILFFASCSALTTIILPSKISNTNPLTLNCPAVNDSVVWEYINATNSKSTYPSTNLNINLTSFTEVGQYICKESDVLVVHYLAAYVATPVFENAHKSLTYIAGDTNKQVVCKSSGSFPKLQFFWKRDVDGFTVDLPSENFTNVNVSYGKDSSTLHFTELTFDVQGMYKCSVENEAANKTIEIEIRVKDRLAALWPFLGILCEVALLITIIFIYEKRSKKASRVKSVEVTGDLDEPLNADPDNEGDNIKLRNRISNNNHK